MIWLSPLDCVTYIFAKLFKDWNINCKCDGSACNVPAISYRPDGYSSEFEDVQNRFVGVCLDEIRPRLVESPSGSALAGDFGIWRAVIETLEEE